MKIALRIGFICIMTCGLLSAFEVEPLIIPLKKDVKITVRATNDAEKRPSPKCRCIISLVRVSGLTANTTVTNGTNGRKSTQPKATVC